MEKLIDNCLKLGFGMMRLPRTTVGGREVIDVEQTKEMVDAFLKAGGKYVDTAFVYEGSEEATRKALVERYPRDAYYLATKLNASSFAAKNEEEAKNELKVSLERTGAGYFDFYLLHALGKENIDKYNEYGLWDYVKQLKAEGIVKHWGFSFHDTADFLDELLTKHPDAEFVQLQINYADWEDENIQSRACLEVAAKHGKPIIVMEPVKGGTLAEPPRVVRDILAEVDDAASPASWAIRFAASRPEVMVVLSGMSNREQMADNLSFMEHFKPLDDKEAAAVEKARVALASIDKIACTACHYCTPGCPMEINIPEIFKAMNVYKIYEQKEKAKARYTREAGEHLASTCIACGQCEGACPQHLPIIDLLREVAETLE